MKEIVSTVPMALAISRLNQTCPTTLPVSGQSSGRVQPYLAQPFGQPVMRITMSSLRKPAVINESSSLSMSVGRYLQHSTSETTMLSDQQTLWRQGMGCITCCFDERPCLPTYTSRSLPWPARMSAMPRMPSNSVADPSAAR